MAVVGHHQHTHWQCTADSGAIALLGKTLPAACENDRSDLRDPLPAALRPPLFATLRARFGEPVAEGLFGYAQSVGEAHTVVQVHGEPPSCTKVIQDTVLQAVSQAPM